MNDSSRQQGLGGRSTALFLCGVIGIAIVGYFVGINDGVPREDAVPVNDVMGADAPNIGALVTTHSPRTVKTPDASANSAVVPAASYSEMRRAETGPTSRWKPTLDQIPQPQYDLFAEIKPSVADKQQSTLTRASRRAFNGAPPVIPHAIERTTDAACYACHGQGIRIGDRIANRMSHGFLANCTQCHATPPPKPFSDVDLEVNSAFVGLPAPLKGERAFPGAPPTIPHSRWMREKCLACHGNEAGWAGLQSTHPWRANCTQCHAPSAQLDQAIVPAQIGFLPALDMNEE